MKKFQVFSVQLVGLVLFCFLSSCSVKGITKSKSELLLGRWIHNHTIDTNLTVERNLRKFGDSEENGYLELLASGKYWRSHIFTTDFTDVVFQAEWTLENEQLILTDSLQTKRFDILRLTPDSLILGTTKPPDVKYYPKLNYIFTRKTAKGLEKYICKTKLDTLRAKRLQVAIEVPEGLTNSIAKTLYEKKVDGKQAMSFVFTRCMLKCSQQEKDKTKEGIWKWDSTHRVLESGYEDILLYEKKLSYANTLFTAEQFFYHQGEPYYFIAESPYLENTLMMVEAIANMKILE